MEICSHTDTDMHHCFYDERSTEWTTNAHLKMKLTCFSKHGLIWKLRDKVQGRSRSYLNKQATFEEQPSGKMWGRVYLRMWSPDGSEHPTDLLFYPISFLYCLLSSFFFPANRSIVSPRARHFLLQTIFAVCPSPPRIGTQLLLSVKNASGSCCLCKGYVIEIPNE